MARTCVFGVGTLPPLWVETEYGVHLVVFQSSDGANGEAEFGAKVDRSVDGLEGTKPENNAAILEAEVYAEVGGERGLKLLRRYGSSLPLWVGGGESSRPLEESGGLGEGLGEDGEVG